MSNLARLDKGVKACNIWQHFTHKLILQNMSQAPHYIGASALENKEKGYEGEYTKERLLGF